MLRTIYNTITGTIVRRTWYCQCASLRNKGLVALRPMQAEKQVENTQDTRQTKAQLNIKDFIHKVRTLHPFNYALACLYKICTLGPTYIMYK